MYDLSRKHGGVMGFQFGNKYTVVLSSPAAVKAGPLVPKAFDSRAGRLPAWPPARPRVQS